MTAPSQSVRRATVADVPKLIPLWQTEQLDWTALEKRFKEFQVVEGDGGELLGAIALQIAANEANLHSEVYADYEQADALRELLWGRLQIVAANHGLTRLWTRLEAPFFREHGFQDPPPDAASNRPAEFEGETTGWKSLQLRDDISSESALDRQFELFRAQEKEESDRIFRQARLMKTVAFLVAFAVLALIAVWVFSLLRLQSRF